VGEAAQLNLPTGTRLGPYEVVASIGSGGMGVVYKARDTRLDRFVAIKVLKTSTAPDETQKARFAQEAKAASALNHPNIITIYEIATYDGVDVIVMEYVDGRTLDEEIGDKGLSVGRTLRYAIPAAQALAKAHSVGIVHRDLKPSNVMISKDGVVKILDFGIAKLASLEPEAATGAVTRTATVRDADLTDRGKILGTAAYMAPEQADGKRVDHRADIFSFGAVLYEMVTGARAFQGDTSLSTLTAVLNTDPPPPSTVAKNIPRDVERVILRCLRKDPARRLQAMGDIALELEDVAADLTSGVTGVQPSGRRRPLWPLLAGFVVVLLMAATWFALWKRNDALPLEIVPLTSFPGDEYSPSFSPDGKQVAFCWTGEDRHGGHIYVALAGGGTPLRLTNDDAFDDRPAWSPDGTRIAFLRYDDKRAGIFLISALGGAERKLLNVPILRLLRFPTKFSWSPDGTHIVTDLPMSDDTNDLVAVDADTGTVRTLRSVAVQTGRYSYPAVSLSGRYLAYGYAGGAIGSHWSLYVAKLGADLSVEGEPQLVRAQEVQLTGLAWTSDNTALVYSAGTSHHLWRIPAFGGAPRELLAGTSFAWLPDVARRGDRLAFVRNDANSDLWKIERSGAPVVLASSTFNEYDPQFSPDGKRIAFVSGRSGEVAIWVANADGTKPVRLTLENGKNPGSPRWSPDGQWIAFDTQIENGNAQVFVIDPAGGQPRRLTHDAENASVPSWSRDGRWIYYESDRTGAAEVWRMPARGGDPVQMTHGGGHTPWESWDGSTLFFLKGMPLVSLFGMPLVGGVETQLADGVWWRTYFPTRDGIYYVAMNREKPFEMELHLLAAPSAKDTVISRFDSLTSGAPTTGLTVSPDGNTVVLAGVRMSAGTDIVLVEHFR
jgi:serine/threonine protein kinase/Tol biopolymer transport system component